MESQCPMKCSCGTNETDQGSAPFVANIMCEARRNHNFRTAAWTGNHLQMTLMCIPVCGEIGVEMHPHTDQFIRVEEGQALICMGCCREELNTKCRLGAGDAVFVPKGTVYVTDFFNVDPNIAIHSYTINFELRDGDGSELLDEGGLRVFAQDHLGEFEPLANELSLVCNDVKYNQLRVMSRFYALLDGLMTCTDERVQDYYPIRKGVDALCAEWDKNGRISRYAELCGISESYFHMLFKKWSGLSPVDYRNRLRISHAKSILQNSSMSVGEVSAAVGFDDRFYFSRVFKALTGVSPQKYRKM